MRMLSTVGRTIGFNQVPVLFVLLATVFGTGCLILPLCYSQDYGIDTQIQVPTGSAGNPGGVQCDPPGTASNPKFSGDPGASTAQHLIDKAMFEFQGKTAPVAPATSGPPGNNAATGNEGGFDLGKQSPGAFLPTLLGLDFTAATSLGTQFGTGIPAINLSSPVGLLGNPQGTSSDNLNLQLGRDTGSDPVNPFDGEFTVRDTDLRFPGVGMGFELIRTYRSRWDYDGPIGYGWDHSYNQRLIFDVTVVSFPPEVRFASGAATTIRFTLVNLGTGSFAYISPPGVHLVLQRGVNNYGGDWTLTEPAGLTKSFDKNGLLTKIIDTNGNQITLSWEPSTREDKFRVQEILDTVGLRHHFTYNNGQNGNAGLLLSVETLGTGERVDYVIDSNHDLRQAKVAGAGFTYTYSSPAQSTESVATDIEIQQACEAGCGSPDIKVPGGQCDQAPQYAQTQCEAACEENRKECVAACTPQCPTICNSSQTKICMQQCKDSASDPCSKAASKTCGDYLDSEGDNACDKECSDNCEKTCPNYSVNDISTGVLFSECFFIEFKNPNACRWHAVNNDCRACCEYGDYCHGGCNDGKNCRDNCRTTFLDGADGKGCAGKFPGCIDRATDWCKTHVDLSVCNQACGADCEPACIDGCNSGCSLNKSCSQECQEQMPGAASLVQTCRTTCLADCRKKLADPSGKKRYGRIQDLGHNMIEIHNPDGTLYLTNNYGQDVYSPDFDAVISQTFATGAVVKFRYHDLLVEGSTGGAKGIDAGLVTQSSDFTPWEPCAFQCADPSISDPALCSKVSMIENAKSRPGALASSATVIEDRQGFTWVVYFDGQGHPLMSVNTTFLWGAGLNAPYLYQYNDKGELVGMKLPFGRQYCQVYDTDGYLKDKFLLPGPGQGVPASPIHQWFKWTGFPKRLQDVSDPRDENKSARHMDYDLKGNLLKSSALDLGIWEYTPDLRGRTAAVHKPSGAWTEYVFAPDTGLTKKIIAHPKYPGPLTIPRTEEMVFSYDKALNLSRIQVSDRVDQVMEWSPGRRLNQLTSRWGGIRQASKITYTYYADGQLKSTDNGYTVRTLTYDAEGLISGITDRGKSRRAREARSWSIERTNAGEIKTLTYPEGKSVFYDRQLSQELGRASWKITTSGGRARKTAVQTGAVFLDLEGKIVGSRDAVGSMTRYFQDGLGRTVQVVDALGNEFRREFDQLGTVKWEARYAAGAPTSTFTRSPLLSDDGLMAWKQLVYDSTGRMRQLSELHAVYRLPSGTDYGRRYPWLYMVGSGWKTVTTDYNPQKETVTIRDSSGNETVHTYDGFGSLLSTKLGDGSLLTLNYTGPRTVVRRQQLPTGFSTAQTVQYNGRGEVNEVNVDGVTVWSAEYDGRGLPVNSRFASGGTIVNKWDEYSRRTAMLVYDDPGLKNVLTSMKYEWNANSHLTAFTDGLGHRTSYSYDDLNRRYKTELADGSTTEIKSFLGAGSMPLQVMEPDGSMFNYQYDDAGNVKGIDIDSHSGAWHGTTKMTFDRDPLGRVIKAFTNNDPGTPTDDVTVELRYDTLGNVTRENKSWANPPPGVTWYDYFPDRTVTASATPNTLGWTNTVSVGSLKAITYELDQLHRLKSVYHGADELAHLVYEGADVLKRTVYANGHSETLTYDKMGRIGSIVNEPAVGTSDRFDLAYGNDYRSLLLQVVKAGSSNRSSLFATDASSRLLTETLSVPNLAPIPADKLSAADAGAQLGQAADWRTYSIDPADNWTQRTGKDPLLLLNPVISPVNSYLEFKPHSRAVYDERGGLIATGTEQYTYNALGQLVKASVNGKTIEYTYDALGRLGRRSVNGHVTEYTTFGSSIIGSLSLDSDTVADIIYGRTPEDTPLSQFKGWYQFAYGPGKARPLANIEGNTGNRYYYHFDPFGSVTAISDSSGRVLEQYDYTAYGETGISDSAGSVLSSGSGIGNPFAFQGQLYDPASKLYLMGARWYRPDWGRFLTQDPIGVAGGQNLYAFAKNSPLLFRDTTGLDPTRITPSPDQVFLDTIASQSSAAGTTTGAPEPGVQSVWKQADAALSTTGEGFPPEVRAEPQRSDPLGRQIRVLQKQNDWLSAFGKVINLGMWWLIGSPTLGLPTGDVEFGPGDDETKLMRDTAAYQEAVQIYREWSMNGRPAGKFTVRGTDCEWVPGKGYFYVEGRAPNTGENGKWTEPIANPLWGFTGAFSIRFRDSGWPGPGYVDVEIENFSSLTSYLGHAISKGNWDTMTFELPGLPFYIAPVTVDVRDITSWEWMSTKTPGIPVFSRSRQVYHFRDYVPEVP